MTRITVSKTDADVGGFLRRLPDGEYLPTWYQLRTDSSYAIEFAKQYPDVGVRSNETEAARKAAAHADTPTAAHLDSLGRTFLTIADNGAAGKYETRTELDIEGNQRAVSDAKSRVVMRYDYDMLGTVIHQASMEAGERWLLNDVSGKPIRTWDSRGFSHRMEYDELRRPAAHYVRGSSQPERQIEKTLYGDTPGAIAQPEKGNHRGKPYQVHDNAGVVVSAAYDFKGNLLRSSRQLRRNYKETADWQQAMELEQEVFRSRTRYDALNRPVQLIAPHSDRAGAKFDIIRPGYSEANLLDRTTSGFHAVTNIDYDAKGQRVKLEYGSGVVTNCEYDPLTYRLTRLLTTRSAGGNGLTAALFSRPGTVQDLRYPYDPAGNITRIEDSALRTVFHSGSEVRPAARYTYDALYHLIEAEGREHLGQCALQPTGNGNCRDYPFAGHGPQPGDPQALRNYLERYVYDEVGNFLSFIHKAESGNWQRDYVYQEASLIEPGKQSNRLSRTVLHPNGSQPVIEPYSYDAHGNMTRMPHLPLMAWDFRDQLCASSRQAVNNGGTPETTYYVYDSSGQRVRKVTESYAAAGGSPAKRQERIYLGGFEVYREWSGLVCDLERLSLHVMDDKQRIALVETKTVGPAEHGDALNSPLVRYQLGNHLGSASLELDRDGALISYEEYHPYGTTALQAGRSAAEVSLKRYRYTGMERDEETGLNYHGARYYAGWLGRWVSCDPAGISTLPNLYEYVGSRPLVLIDKSGLEGSHWFTIPLLDELATAIDANLNADARKRASTKTPEHSPKESNIPLTVAEEALASTHDLMTKGHGKGAVDAGETWQHEFVQAVVTPNKNEAVEHGVKAVSAAMKFAYHVMTGIDQLKQNVKQEGATPSPTANIGSGLNPLIRHFLNIDRSQNNND